MLTRRFQACVLFLLVTAPLSQAQRLTTFPWSDGIWKSELPELVSFRATARSLFSEDRIPHGEIDSLYKRLVTRYGKAKDPIDLGKILILESYFPNRHYRHKFDIVEEMLTVPGLDTYEYARAAWCVLAMQQTDIVKWRLYPKLRERDPDDVAVKWSAIDMWGFGYQGEPPVTMLPKFADEMLKSYPQRDEFLLMPAIYAYAKFYERQPGRPTETLRKLVDLARRHIAHPQASNGPKNATRSFIKQYEDELKRRGG